MKKVIFLLHFLMLSMTLAAQQGATIIPSSFQLVGKLDLPDQGSSFGQDNLEMGDLDGDGKPDIVTGIRQGAGLISVFRNNVTAGNLTIGSFEARIDLSTDDGDISTPYINGLDLADFDGDGKIDILFGSHCLVNHVGVIRNTSSPGSLSAANFSFPFYFEAPGCPTDVFAADIDTDGRPDIIVSRSNSPSFGMYVLRNTSTPGNLSFAAFVEFTTLTSRGRLNAADLDNDGKPEIIVGYSADSGNDLLSVFRNTSSPGSILLATRQDFFIGTGVRPWHTAIGDFNKDGKRDIAVANRSDGISILKNNSVAGNVMLNIDAQVPMVTETGSQPGIIQVFDMNGDGLVDIIGTVDNRAEVGIVTNVSNTNVIEDEMFAAPVSFGLPTGTGAGYCPMQVSDLNNDSKPDIIYMQRAGIYIHENNIERAPKIRSVSSYTRRVGESITITGDFFDPAQVNNIVLFGQVKANVTSATSSSLTVVIPPGASADYITVSVHGLTGVSALKFVPLFGSGATFDTNSFAPGVNFAMGRSAQNIEISDLDLDGKPDIVVSMGNIGLLHNTSINGTIDGTSLSVLPEIALGASGVNSIGLYDLTGDGKADILRNGSSAPGIFQNLSTAGEISFGSSIPAGVSTNDAGLGLPAYDLDFDGKIDLVYAGPSQEINIVRNLQRTDPLGATTITNLRDFQNGGNPMTILNGTVRLGGVTAGDFDGDDKVDLAVVLATDNKITIARNTTSLGNFPIKIETTDLPADPSCVAIETIDLDGDGKLDLAVTSQTNDRISVYHNNSTPGNLNFEKIDFTTDNDPTLIRAADLDGDGKPELICIYNSLAKFSVFKNTSNDAPQFANRVDFTLTNPPRGLAIGDIDLDGKPDIIIGQAQNVTVFKNLLAATTPLRIDQQPTDVEACPLESVTFAVGASGPAELQYQWQEDSGSGFVNLTNNSQYSGTTTFMLMIGDVTPVQSGNRYRCIVSAGTQSVTSSTANLAITNVEPPGVVDVSSCQLGSVTLTATGGVNGNYRWYRSLTGVDPIEGEANSSYTTPVLTETTSFFVSLVNGRCESDRAEIRAVIGNLPAPGITADGPLTFCEGDFVTLRGPDGFLEYSWSDGSTTQEIEIISSSTVTLQVGDGNCFSEPSQAVVITVNPAPEKPDIEIINDILVTAFVPGLSYQWYDEGEAIPGAVTNYLVINFTEFGDYVVEVSFEGCTNSSLPFTYIYTEGDGDSGSNGRFSVFPNPFDEELHLAGWPLTEDLRVEIWDVSGRQKIVHRAEDDADDGVLIDTRELPPGYYVLMTYRKGERTPTLRRILKRGSK